MRIMLCTITYNPDGTTTRHNLHSKGWFATGYDMADVWGEMLIRGHKVDPDELYAVYMHDLSPLEYGTYKWDKTKNAFDLARRGDEAKKELEPPHTYPPITVEACYISGRGR